MGFDVRVALAAHDGIFASDCGPFRKLRSAGHFAGSKRAGGSDLRGERRNSVRPEVAGPENPVLMNPALALFRRY